MRETGKKMDEMKVARGGGVGLIPVKWREDSPLDYQTV